ncbi:protein inscuteable homolog isoform X2 [Procambarus clarkii]|uniref:protein inscuteable homolog isoform X2 n=1 Tax=Procambarus clarkii TaxID=6728 RepID=UPI0037423C56
MAQSVKEVPRLHNFRRGGSRVYYASEDGCWPANNLPRGFWTRHKSIPEPVIPEAGEEASSSGEEVSPGGSLRGSPSHRSQDSGYSDSGESSNAQNDTDSLPTTPPNVKHITRVYFGEPPRLYNDKIVCIPSVNSNTASASSSEVVDTPSPDACRSQQHGQATTLEEEAEELEHKSVLDASSRRTGAVRKRVNSSATATAVQRRPQKRSSSTEKLNAEAKLDQHRRPPAPRTRRRWSIGDVQQQQQQQQQATAPSYVSCGTNTPVTYGAGDRSSSTKLMPRAGDSRRLEWPAGPQEPLRQAQERTLDAVLPPPMTHPPVALAQQMRNASLQQWVKELSVLCESECMNTLQSKSIPGDGHRGSKPTTKTTSTTTTTAATSTTATTTSTTTSISTRHAVRAIKRRAHIVSTEFSRLCQLEWLDLGQVPVLAGSVVTHINNFLKDYTTQWTSADPDLQPQSSLGRQRKVVQQICERLTEVCSGGRGDPDAARQVVQVVTALGHAFTKLVDLMLSREITVVVRSLEEAGSSSSSSSSSAAVLTVVAQLTALGVDGGHSCRLIARLGGVRCLLGICLEPRLRQCRVDALRALATVCCVLEGVTELEKAGGVEVVAEVLCDEEGPEEERSEAAGVLAQITSPWVENAHRLAALHTHMGAIVAALTDLAEFTRTPETFLLASAALANLTFLGEECVEVMRSAGTVRVLLKAAEDNPSISIFTKDQIATVLANLAGWREAAEEVVVGGGVALLLALLHTRPAPTHRLPEVATAERIQQKSAIALSRLCREASVAQQVVELGGAARLVRLCKDEEERNHSDAVLVACLAALRKIASSLGSEELRGMDAAELVEPRLLDSFLIYSSRQESFV